MAAAHVVTDPGAATGHLGVRCTHCGSAVAFALPISVDNLVLLVGAFEEAHAECARSDPKGGAS